MNVYCDEKYVGRLVPSADEWLLAMDNTPVVPLSPSISLAKGQRQSSVAIRDFLVNYLPEEPHASRVAARLQPLPRSPQDWLSALGQELTGAYAVTPSGLALSEPRYRELRPESLFEALHSSRTRADAIAFALATGQSLPRLSLAGAQDKFALWYEPPKRSGSALPSYKIAEGRAATTHIFKPESTDARYPFLPANEYASSQLGSALGLDVCATSLVTLGGVRTLIVTRFDRFRRGGLVKRLHQIDLCQLLNLPRERKYGSQGAGVDTADFFAACQGLAVPALARQAHLRAWLFNFLLGNQDAHAKNYSFLHDLRPTGGWRVAPLYDLICVVPYLPEQTLSMGLLEEYRAGWFEKEHWNELARLAGVSPAYVVLEVRQLLERMKAAVPSLQSSLRKALSDEELDFLSTRVNPVIQQRAELLNDAVAKILV